MAAQPEEIYYRPVPAGMVRWGNFRPMIATKPDTCAGCGGPIEAGEHIGYRSPRFGEKRGKAAHRDHIESGPISYSFTDREKSLLDQHITQPVEGQEDRS